MAEFIDKFSEVTNSAVKGLLSGSLFGAAGGALLLGTVAAISAIGTSASVLGAFGEGAFLGVLEGANSGASAGLLIGAAIGLIHVARQKDAPEQSREDLAKASFAQGVAVGQALEAQQHAQEQAEDKIADHHRKVAGYRAASGGYREAVFLSAEQTMHRLH